MSEPRWGERRAAARHRARRRWIGGIVAVLLASPFALDVAARRYFLAGGTMPDGRFPLWIPLLYWGIVMGIATTGVVRLYRASDEFERRRLIDGFAASGLVLGLCIPPAFFVGTSNGMMLVWLAALLTGIAVFALRRATP